MSDSKAAICPACQGEFSKRDNGKCPECGVKLNMVRTKEGNKQLVKYELAEQVAEPTHTSKTTLIQLRPVIIDETKDGYHIIFQAFAKEARCPGCGKLQFKIFQFGQGQKIERKCDRCKKTNLFEFNILVK